MTTGSDEQRPAPLCVHCGHLEADQVVITDVEGLVGGDVLYCVPCGPGHGVHNFQPAPAPESLPRALELDAIIADGVMQREDGADFPAEQVDALCDSFIEWCEAHELGFGGSFGYLTAAEAVERSRPPVESLPVGTNSARVEAERRYLPKFGGDPHHLSKIVAFQAGAEWARPEERETADHLDVVLREVALVYDELTEGKFSKASTSAVYVIEAVREIQERELAEERKARGD